MMIDRLRWIAWRRIKYAFLIKGFYASIRSYADPNTRFEGYNVLNGTTIINSSLGMHTYASSARIVNCSIGKFSSIGPEVMAGGLGRHPLHFASTHPIFYSKFKQSGSTFADVNYFDELLPVTIGNDVWIGARAIVLDGITIGDGAVIAAGAVVVSNVEPYAIVAGVPAKPICYRFDEKTISDLLSIKWWDWPLETLKKTSHLFRSDVPKIIKQLIEYSEQKVV